MTRLEALRLRSMCGGAIAFALGAAISACGSSGDSTEQEPASGEGAQNVGGAATRTNDSDVSSVAAPPPAVPGTAAAPTARDEASPNGIVRDDRDVEAGPAPSEPVAPQPTPGVPGVGCLAAGSGDFSDDGPYRVATEVVDLGDGIASNQATGDFTIFYPQPFETDCPHPIVAWGNGTGVTGPGVYEFFNHNAASWGVVVIAAHDSNTGSGGYHRRGIDYLLARNEDPSSPFFGKLSPRAGVSGHSQGGFGAAQAASHPNVQALVPIGASGRALETTAFLCLTGTEDIAPDACRSAVDAAPGPAMAAIWDGGDHVRTETIAGFLAGDPGTIQMMRLYAAWFRCFLANDATACGLFEGEDCSVCSDDGWAEVVTRNL